MATCLWLYVAALACVYVCVRADLSYDTFRLDSFRVCGNGKESASIYLRPWKAAILTFGNVPGTDQQSDTANRDIHECKVSFKTGEGFGLGAVIQHMSIDATLNRETHGWQCDGDYIKMSTLGTSTISKILGILYSDFFKSKKTDQLCGLRGGRPRFSEVGSNADVFSTFADNIEIFFHQAQSKSAPLNNSFMIVVTSFKHVKEAAFSDECAGKFMCKGSEHYCVANEYVCDSHYNCAMPLGGGDEARCKAETEFYHPFFSTTTTIIVVLASIVGCGCVLGAIITLFRKVPRLAASHSRSATPHPGLFPDTSAPPMQRQHTLPPYEAVGLTEADAAWKTSRPDAPPPGEKPPDYDALFPDGPPRKIVDTPSAPTIPTSPTTPAFPTTATAPPPPTTSPTPPTSPPPPPTSPPPIS